MKRQRWFNFQIDGAAAEYGRRSRQPITARQLAPPDG